MATGLAIMGFGGGALIGTPLADVLMRRFATPASVGVWQTFVCFGVIYFAAMIGAVSYRLPPAGWSPRGSGHRACLDGDDAQRSRGRGLEDTAVLGTLGGALPERERRNRSARDGVADDPGSFQGARGRVRGGGIRGAAEPVQHRGANLLGLVVGPAWPQADVYDLFRARLRSLRERTVDRRGRQPGALRRDLLHHPHDVWRRVRDDPPTSPTSSEPAT